MQALELPDEAARRRAQLTNRSVALDVRVAAALRLKQLAGEGLTDLKGAELAGANLNDANFYGADFSGAKLSGAKLRRV
ncbi:MAG TPA: pentapeptide repeat-containing protein, partial [Polyangiales bacterium]|nr:pentapeptide repeat-containing protein [Polyangiales bacterium]